MRKTLATLAIIAMVFSVAWAASTPSVTVQWTMPTVNIDGAPLTDLAGAKIYYGTASSNYTHVVDVGMVESYTVTGLVEGVTYYFNGTAYNTAGLESDFCNEVAKVATKSGSVIRLAADRPPRRLWIGRE